MIVKFILNNVYEKIPKDLKVLCIKSIQDEIVLYGESSNLADTVEVRIHYQTTGSDIAKGYYIGTVVESSLRVYHIFIEHLGK